MDILLPNDDSYASPLLQFALTKLQTLGQVTTVVPKEEQSWTPAPGVLTIRTALHGDDVEIQFQEYGLGHVRGSPRPDI